jgi:hypothetical protein
MPNEYDDLAAPLQGDLQAHADSTAPCVESTPSGHDAAGRFTAGNQAARRHGLRAFQLHGDTTLAAELRAELAEFREGVERDQGGAEELTTLGAGYVRRLSEVEAICVLLGADLQTRGLLTRRGRVRSTYNAFLQAIDRWDRLAQRLGLARKAKPVQTLEQYLQARTDAAHVADSEMEAAASVNSDSAAASAEERNV